MLIWGIRRYVQQLAVFLATCSAQGHSAAHRLLRRRTKFTLFFVPLIPLGSTYHLVCTMCGGTTKIDAERVPEIQGEAARQQLARTAHPDVMPG